AVADFLKADDLIPIVDAFNSWLAACKDAANEEGVNQFILGSPVDQVEETDDEDSKTSPSTQTKDYGCPWTTYPLLKKYTFNLNHSLRPLWVSIDRKLAAEDYLSVVKERMTATGKSGRRNVLVCGGGPAGLRAAIECCLLRCDRVVIIEKRLRLTRFNVLHVWRFGLADLKSLGAKALFRGLGLGSLDVISIRRVQVVLLKIALLLGAKGKLRKCCELNEIIIVLVFPGTEYLRSIPSDPPRVVSSRYPLSCNWCAEFMDLQSDSPLSRYRYNILIAANGPIVFGQTPNAGVNIANEFSFNHLVHGQTINANPNSGPTAVGITANFVLDKSNAAERAFGDKEGGRVSYLNKEFFKRLKENHNIEIENIAFYRSDESHYLVFTPRKSNLISRGVVKSDIGTDLLKPFNLNRKNLLQLARDLATACDIPETCEFVKIHNSRDTGGELREDVNIFDFSTKTAATRPSILVVPPTNQPSPLLVGLVGDSLLAPFWPLGTGLAHATLSSLDLAWTISKMGDPLNWLCQPSQLDSGTSNWVATQKCLEFLELHRQAYTLLTTATGESVLAPEELAPASNRKMLAALGSGMMRSVSPGRKSQDADRELEGTFVGSRSFENLKDNKVQRGSTLFKLQVQVDDFMDDGAGAKNTNNIGLMGIIIIPLEPSGRYLKGKNAIHAKGSLGSNQSSNVGDGVLFYQIPSESMLEHYHAVQDARIIQEQIIQQEEALVSDAEETEMIIEKTEVEKNQMILDEKVSTNNIKIWNEKIVTETKAILADTIKPSKMVIEDQFFENGSDPEPSAGLQSCKDDSPILSKFPGFSLETIDKSSEYTNKKYTASVQSDRALTSEVLTDSYSGRSSSRSQFDRPPLNQEITRPSSAQSNQSTSSEGSSSLPSATSARSARTSSRKLEKLSAEALTVMRSKSRMDPGSYEKPQIDPANSSRPKSRSGFDRAPAETSTFSARPKSKTGSREFEKPAEVSSLLTMRPKSRPPSKEFEKLPTDSMATSTRVKSRPPSREFERPSMDSSMSLNRPKSRPPSKEFERPLMDSSTSLTRPKSRPPSKEFEKSRPPSREFEQPSETSSLSTRSKSRTSSRDFEKPPTDSQIASTRPKSRPSSREFERPPWGSSTSTTRLKSRSLSRHFDEPPTENSTNSLGRQPSTRPPSAQSRASMDVPEGLETASSTRLISRSNSKKSNEANSSFFSSSVFSSVASFIAPQRSASMTEDQEMSIERGSKHKLNNETGENNSVNLRYAKRSASIKRRGASPPSDEVRPGRGGLVPALQDAGGGVAMKKKGSMASITLESKDKESKIPLPSRKKSDKSLASSFFGLFQYE
ncbi:hypothetical protein HK096_005350, partial [Nowakowskiella sp. JEL0078]